MVLKKVKKIKKKITKKKLTYKKKLHSKTRSKRKKSIKKQRTVSKREISYLKKTIEELENNHILYEAPPYIKIKETIENSPTLRKTIKKKFYMLSFIDAKEGIPNKKFSVNKFYKSVYKSLAIANDYQAQSNKMHLQDISQFIRDLPPSLFCFINGHLFPEKVLIQLREFTQFQHSVIFFTHDASKLKV